MSARITDLIYQSNRYSTVKFVYFIVASCVNTTLHTRFEKQHARALIEAATSASLSRCKSSGITMYSYILQTSVRLF